MYATLDTADRIGWAADGEDLFAHVRKMAEMTLDPATGKYTGTIPGSFIVPQWDLMYFVEALPVHGPGRKAPDLEHEMPYVIVPVER